MTTLTAERIQSEALALVEEGGADHLTMRRLADRLGVEAPSLYHHVANKAALVDHLFDALVALAPPPPATTDPQDHLRELAHGWQALLRAHPQVLALVGARPSRFLALVDRADPSVELLVQGGMDAAAARALLQALVVLVVGQAEVEQAGASQGDPSPLLDALIRGAWEGVRPAPAARAPEPAPAPAPPAPADPAPAPPAPAAPAPAPPAPADPAPVAPAAPAPAPRPETAETPRRGLASRLIRRAGHLLGGED